MTTTEPNVAGGAATAPALGKQDPASAETGLEGTEGESTAERLRLLALGKQKDETANVPAPLGVPLHPPPGLRSPSPTGIPPRSASPKFLPTSPARLPQGAGRVSSPTSSLIFERNVQEDVVPAAASPAIPAHIATENHIPPVLEEASKAITEDIDPDSVEIVTHAAHQPAATVVSAGSEMPLTPLHPIASMASSMGASPAADRHFGAPQLPHPDLGTSPIVLPVPMSSSFISSGSPPQFGSDGGPGRTSEDGSSAAGGNANMPNYSSLADTSDVRRLSFISFADVVHAEQVVGGDAASIRDSVIVSPAAGPASPPAGVARSPSPLRSPGSPSLSADSGAGSGPGGVEMESSPSARGRGGSPSAGAGGGSMQSSTLLHSIQGNSPPVGNTGGELTIETMRQALRKTASGDLSAVRASIASEGATDEEKK